MPPPSPYGTDLAFIHDAGYGGFGRAAVPGLVTLLRQAGIERGTLVELGCGSGAASAGLVGAGFDVQGIDVSAAMLRLARRRVPRARFVLGRLPDVDLPPCSAIVAVSEVLNYVTGPRAFDRVFRRAFHVLAPGGLFVFDVRQPGRPGPPTVHGRVGGDWAVLARTTEGPKRGALERRITTFRRVGRTYRRSDEVHRLALVPAPLLARKLRAAGFRARILHAYGRTPLPAGHALLVARKPRQGA